MRLPCNATPGVNRCGLGVEISYYSELFGARVVGATRFDRGGGWVTYEDGELLSAVRQRFISNNGVSGRQFTNPLGGELDVLANISSIRGCFTYRPYPALESGWTVMGIPLPGTVCGTAVPPDATCDSLPTLNYDFGTVKSGETHRLTMSQRQTLNCTNTTAVTIKLVSALRLSESLSAQMSVNGMALNANGVTLKMVGDSMPLDFVVTTVGSETGAGVYTASSVLIVEYK